MEQTCITDTQLYEKNQEFAKNVNFFIFQFQDSEKISEDSWFFSDENTIFKLKIKASWPKLFKGGFPLICRRDQRDFGKFVFFGIQEFSSGCWSESFRLSKSYLLDFFQ